MAVRGSEPRLERDEATPLTGPTGKAPTADRADTARRLKAIFVGSSGNLVEWFDFYTYSAFALYFAGAFFPPRARRRSFYMPPPSSRSAS